MSQTLKLYIPKVLSENKIVLLKGIGTLQMNYRPAEIDLDAGIMLPPREEIFFVPANERKLDPVLIRVVEFIARVDEDEAADLVENFMFDLQGELKEIGRLILPSIGTIMKDTWGNLFFEPAPEYISMNKFFGLSQVTLPEALSPAEQEVIADLKETVAEKAATDALMVQQGGRSRTWGFIIGASVILIVLLLASFFIEHSPSSMQDLTRQLDRAMQHEMVEEPADKYAAVDSDVTEEPGTNSDEFLIVEDQSETPLARPAAHQEEIPTSCAVIVGAFQNLDNVDRMIDRIASSSEYESVIIEGPRLTKVGLRFTCEEDPETALAWAKQNIDREAWLYHPEE